MSEKIKISNRTLLLVAFIAGLVVSALLSLFFLIAYSKFGLAPTAGIIFLTGGVFGSRLMSKFMSGAVGTLLKERNFDDPMNVVLLQTYKDLLVNLNKYDKDTVISHIEKLRDDKEEELDAIFEWEIDECPDCGGLH